MRELTVKDAINEALRETMQADPDVVLFGEDIAGGQGRDAHPGAMDAWGGPFGVTKGLCTEFGRDRVRDTTIAEAGFFGAAIGGAMVGMRPVCELMYADFAGVCFDQMMNQAAKMRYMFGGKQNVPMVMRTVVGGGFRAGAEHSQTLYSLFAHIPGLKVVAPYSAADAKGLLIAAIRDDDPVVFFEHKRLYMQTEAVPEGDDAIPLGRGRRRREGRDVTVIAVQRMNLFAEQAANDLEAEGIGVDLIDPRSYAPLDEEMILASVKKTGRVVVVDESYPRCSLAADIAALIAEKAFKDLRAPVLKVTAPHTPVPFSPPMEDFYLPSRQRITRRIKEVISYDG